MGIENLTKSKYTLPAVGLALAVGYGCQSHSTKQPSTTNPSTVQTDNGNTRIPTQKERLLEYISDLLTFPKPEYKKLLGNKYDALKPHKLYKFVGETKDGILSYILTDDTTKVYTMKITERNYSPNGDSTKNIGDKAYTIDMHPGTLDIIIPADYKQPIKTIGGY